MKISQIYKPLLDELNQLGYDVYSQPFGEVDSANISGITLHFCPDNAASEKTGDSPIQRGETVRFICEVSQMSVANDIVDMLSIIDIAVDRILKANTGNATIDELSVNRTESDEPDHILYRIEFTYQYWKSYET
jgi:hypothetical protein